jgi:integrase
MRRTEVSLLKVSDIDSRRMMIRVERGMGGGGRDLPLSPALLETLREYWRWKKPRNYLFPATQVIAFPTAPSRIRPSGTPVKKPPAMRVSRSM